MPSFSAIDLAEIQQSSKISSWILSIISGVVTVLCRPGRGISQVEKSPRFNWPPSFWQWHVMVHVPLIFVSEWREFPLVPSLAGEKLGDSSRLHVVEITCVAWLSSFQPLWHCSPNVCLRSAWISFGALPCRKKNLMTANVSMLRIAWHCFLSASVTRKTCNLAHEQTPLSSDTINSVLRHREVGRAKDLTSIPSYFSSHTSKFVPLMWKSKKIFVFVLSLDSLGFRRENFQHWHFKSLELRNLNPSMLLWWHLDFNVGVC